MLQRQVEMNSAFLGKLDRIITHIDQHLLEAQRVGNNIFRQWKIIIDAVAQATFLCLYRDQVLHMADQLEQ